MRAEKNMYSELSGSFLCTQLADGAPLQMAGVSALAGTLPALEMPRLVAGFAPDDRDDSSESLDMRKMLTSEVW